MGDKTERMSAADFRNLPVAGKGRKSAKPLHVPQEPPIFEPAAPGKGASYTFTYSGAVVSQNKTFAGMHWTKRNALTEKWHGIFSQLMREAGVQPMQRFSLSLRFNSRHDVDNLVLSAKWAVDAMKGVYIPDDSKKYYRGISVFADESLPTNTFIFTLSEIL